MIPRTTAERERARKARREWLNNHPGYNLDITTSNLSELESSSSGFTSSSSDSSSDYTSHSDEDLDMLNLHQRILTPKLQRHHRFFRSAINVTISPPFNASSEPDELCSNFALNTPKEIIESPKSGMNGGNSR